MGMEAVSMAEDSYMQEKYCSKGLESYTCIASRKDRYGYGGRAWNFPPPLSCAVRNSSNHYPHSMPVVMLHQTRTDGRLILRKPKSERQEATFKSVRKGGRLVLFLVFPEEHRKDAKMDEEMVETECMDGTFCEEDEEILFEEKEALFDEESGAKPTKSEGLFDEESGAKPTNSGGLFVEKTEALCDANSEGSNVAEEEEEFSRSEARKGGSLFDAEVEDLLGGDQLLNKTKEREGFVQMGRRAIVDILNIESDIEEKQAVEEQIVGRPDLEEEKAGAESEHLSCDTAANLGTPELDSMVAELRSSVSEQLGWDADKEGVKLILAALHRLQSLDLDFSAEENMILQRSWHLHSARDLENYLYHNHHQIINSNQHHLLHVLQSAAEFSSRCGSAQWNIGKAAFEGALCVQPF